jgi:transcriptional regulator with XRE-family HTH domain
MDRTWIANGRALRILREDAWLSQAELAELSGVSHATISKIEQGRRPYPHNRTLSALATALDVDPHILREAPNGGRPLADLLMERQLKISGARWDLGNDPQQRAFG